MRSIHWTKFIILCLSICFILMGCASPEPALTSTPIPVKTETPYPMAVPYGVLPTATPEDSRPPIQLEKLHILCTSVNVTNAKDLPQVLHDLLEVMGYQLNLQIARCDAILDIQMTGEALSEEYEVSNSNEYRTCYNGVVFTGVITLTAPDAIPLVQTINEGEVPPTLIDENYNQFCREAAIYAPYEEVWPIALVRGLKQILGDAVVIAALQLPALQNTERMLDPAPYSDTLVQGLIGLLENPDSAVSAPAKELTRVMRPIPEEIILAMARQLENEQTNAGLLNILVDAGPVAKVALPQIVAILNSTSDPGVRRDAISAISNIGSSAYAADAALVLALQDPDTLIRMLAAEALGEIMAPPEVAVQPLIDTCWDVDFDLRYATQLALSQITNQPDHSSWDCTMWQKWWDTPATATPQESPLPGYVLLLDAPDAFAEKWRQWNGKYVVYFHITANIQSFNDLNDRLLWLSLVDTALTADESQQMIDDATLLGTNSGISANITGTSNQSDFDNFRYETSHYTEDGYYTDLLLRSSLVGFMLPEVAHYYHLDQNWDFVRVEFE